MTDNRTIELKPEVSWDTMRCCGTCFHFGRQIGHGQTIESNAEGACRCNPPTVLPYPDDCSFGTVFPPVNKEDWCGEWKPKADELGSGTCGSNVVEEFIPGKRQRWNICECSNCGFIVDDRFKCCPNCGMTIRKAVER